jgi:hypothetical protein
MENVAALVEEFGNLVRASRIKRGYVDMDIDRVVDFAKIDLINSCKGPGFEAQVLAEVEWQRECNARIGA